MGLSNLFKSFLSLHFTHYIMETSNKQPLQELMARNECSSLEEKIKKLEKALRKKSEQNKRYQSKLQELFETQETMTEKDLLILQGKYSLNVNKHLFQTKLNHSIVINLNISSLLDESTDKATKCSKLHKYGAYFKDLKFGFQKQAILNIDIICPLFGTFKTEIQKSKSQINSEFVNLVVKFRNEFNRVFIGDFIQDNTIKDLIFNLLQQKYNYYKEIENKECISMNSSEIIKKIKLIYDNIENLSFFGLNQDKKCELNLLKKLDECKTIFEKNCIFSELLEFSRLSVTCFERKTYVKDFFKRFLQSSDNWNVKSKIDELDFDFYFTSENNYIPEIIFGISDTYDELKCFIYYIKLIQNYVKINKNIQVHPIVFVIVKDYIFYVYGACCFKDFKSLQLNFYCDLLFIQDIGIMIDNENQINSICLFFKTLINFVNLIKQKRKIYNFENSFKIPLSLLQQPLIHKEFDIIDYNELIFRNGNQNFKFVRKYGFNAHQIATSFGIAPPFTVSQIHSSLYLIRIDCVDGCFINELSNSNYCIKQIQLDWKKFLSIFGRFSSQFVHGDLRSSNIIYGYCNGILGFYLLQFNWSGLHNKSFYPYDCSIGNSLLCGSEITPTHDRSLIKGHSKFIYQLLGQNKIK